MIASPGQSVAARQHDAQDDEVPMAKCESCSTGCLRKLSRYI